MAQNHYGRLLQEGRGVAADPDLAAALFEKAAAQAMHEGMPNSRLVLLEPIFKVTIALPNEFTSNIQRLVSGWRGQILGFDAKPDWGSFRSLVQNIP